MNVMLLLWCLVGSPEGATPPETVENYASRAFEASKEGRYQEAVRLYLKAYELSPLPSILFNIGVLYDRRLNEPSIAADYYQRYLASPDGDKELARRATSRLEQIRSDLQRARQAKQSQTLDDAEKTPATKPAPAAQVSAPGAVAAAPLSPSKWAAITLGAVGGVSVITGLGFGVNALSLKNQAAAGCSARTCVDEKSLATSNQAMNSANVANVLVGAGVALGAAAVIIAIVTSSPSAPTVSVQPVAGGASLVFGGAF